MITLNSAAKRHQQQDSIATTATTATDVPATRISRLRAAVCRKCLMILPDLDPLVQVMLTFLLIKVAIGFSFDRETVRVIATLVAIIAEELI